MKVLEHHSITNSEKIHMIDPSELLRPEAKFADKNLSEFRNYDIDDSDPLKRRVRNLYVEMHTNQCVQTVKDRMENWLKFDKFKSTIMDALVKLNDIVDESDPDADFPNIVHAFQTAERIRENHPDKDWLQLVGLIHDLGKIMVFYGEPQYACVGDTYPVGCAWGKSIVFCDSTFENNPDTHNPKYNTKYGIYKPNCGLDKINMSWGHDEYMYRVLKHNKINLPEEAFYIIRYHSFYPWHTGGDYGHLCSDKDLEMKKWILEFNKYDLYSKSTSVPDIEALMPYYQSLIDKYIPGELQW